MVRIFIGGISSVGKDYLINKSNVLNYLEGTNIDYIHFGDEMNKYFRGFRYDDLSKNRINKIRDIVFEKIFSSENVLVNGHYMIPNYNLNNSSISSIDVFPELKKFDKYILIESTANEISDRRKRLGRGVYDRNLIKEELDFERNSFKKYSKFKPWHIINNSDRNLRKSERELVDIILNYHKDTCSLQNLFK